MAEFTATVDDTADVTDLASGEVDFLRLVDDTADVTDLASGEVEFLRAVDETAVVADAVSCDVDYARVNDDAVASTDALAPVSESARSFSDTVTLSDDVDVKALIVEDGVTVSDAIASALITLNVVIADGVAMSDALVIEGVAFTVAIGDAVVVTDSAASGFVKAVTRSDSLVLTDQALRTVTLGRVLGDSVSVADAIVSDATIVFSIGEAHALSESRVRVTFSVPALNDDALSDPTNYVFDNVSVGTVDVSPFSVFIPPGQPQPSYVEIETSEHTDGGTYQVALKSVIRGGSGEFADETPYAYTGIGVAPEIAVVIATSPTLVEVHFTEAIADNHDARSKYNYKWTGGLQTIEVLSVIGEVVTLRTSEQVPGTLYTLTVTATEPLAADEVISDAIDVADSLIALPIPLVAIVDDTIDVSDTITKQIDSVALIMVVGRATSPSDAAQIQSSRDGINWKIESVPYAAPPSTLYACTFRYVLYPAVLNFAVGSDGSQSMLYRSDGVSAWDLQKPVVADSHFAGIAYNSAGRIVVGGTNSFWYSDNDGVSWTQTPHGAGSPNAYYWSVVYSVPLGLFVAVGGDTSPSIQTSPDGINWTYRASGGSFSSVWRGVTWIGPSISLFVIGGDSSADNLQTSPDGITWTPRTPGSGWSGDIQAVAGGVDRFIFVGSSGGVPEIQSSFDGINWAHRNVAGGYAGTFYGATYRGSPTSKFVICGTGSEIQTSTDAVTWTHRAEGGASAATFHGAG